MGNELVRYKVDHDEDPMNPRQDESASVCALHLPFCRLEEEIPGEIIYEFPVYAYKHSDVAFSLTPFGCRFDSARAGTAYVTKELVESVFGASVVTPSLERVKRAVEAELQMYENYLNGNFYTLTVTKGAEVVYWVGGLTLREVSEELKDNEEVKEGFRDAVLEIKVGEWVLPPSAVTCPHCAGLGKVCS